MNSLQLVQISRPENETEFIKQQIQLFQQNFYSEFAVNCYYGNGFFSLRNPKLYQVDNIIHYILGWCSAKNISVIGIYNSDTGDITAV